MRAADTASPDASAEEHCHWIEGQPFRCEVRPCAAERAAAGVHYATEATACVMPYDATEPCLQCAYVTEQIHSAEFAAYARGLVEGLKEAAAICDALSVSARGNDYGSVGNAFDECADAILERASGNAPMAPPSASGALAGSEDLTQETNQHRAGTPGTLDRGET